MADKSISELVAATAIGSTDLFVLEQGGTAKKLTGQILENWLVSYADGHGGIQSFIKTSSSGTNPVIDTYTITFADESTSTVTVTNGVKGDKGDQTYVHFKYSDDEPVADSDMYDTPDNWIGIYSGTSETPPTSYTAYDWYKFKGDKGDTGDAAELDDQNIAYQWSNSGTIVPSGTWSPSIPARVSGYNFLWTQVTIAFNTGDPVTFYSVGHYGEDGEGAVASVNGIGPIEGDVTITAGDIQTSDNNSVQTHLDNAEADITTLKTYEALHLSVASFSSLPETVSNSKITADMRVIECVFGTPSAITSDITWTTSAGSLVLSGSMSGSTTAEITLIKTN